MACFVCYTIYTYIYYITYYVNYTDIIYLYNSLYLLQQRHKIEEVQN